jgi:hypothetical protein
MIARGWQAAGHKQLESSWTHFVNHKEQSGPEDTTCCRPLVDSLWPEMWLVIASDHQLRYHVSLISNCVPFWQHSWTAGTQPASCLWISTTIKGVLPLQMRYLCNKLIFRHQYLHSPLDKIETHSGMLYDCKSEISKVSVPRWLQFAKENRKH